MTYGYLLMSWMLLTTPSSLTILDLNEMLLEQLKLHQAMEEVSRADVCARAESIALLAPCTRRDGCEAADRWQEHLGGEPGLRVLTPYDPPAPDPRPAQVPRRWPGALCPLGR